MRTNPCPFLGPPLLKALLCFKDVRCEEQNLFIVLLEFNTCSTDRMSNVSVCVRFRPLSHKEKKANGDKVYFKKLDSESFVFKVWTGPSSACCFLYLSRIKCTW